MFVQSDNVLYRNTPKLFSSSLVFGGTESMISDIAHFSTPIKFSRERKKSLAKSGNGTVCKKNREQGAAEGH